MLTLRICIIIAVAMRTRAGAAGIVAFSVSVVGCNAIDSGPAIFGVHNPADRLRGHAARWSSEQIASWPGCGDRTEDQRTQRDPQFGCIRRAAFLPEQPPQLSIHRFSTLAHAQLEAGGAVVAGGRGPLSWLPPLFVVVAVAIRTRSAHQGHIEDRAQQRKHRRRGVPQPHNASCSRRFVDPERATMMTPSAFAAKIALSVTARRGAESTMT